MIERLVVEFPRVVVIFLPKADRVVFIFTRVEGVQVVDLSFDDALLAMREAKRGRK